MTNHLYAFFTRHQLKCRRCARDSARRFLQLVSTRKRGLALCPWTQCPRNLDSEIPECTKRATSVNVQLPCRQKDLRTGSSSRVILNFLSELCRCRGVTFTEVARLVPPETQTRRFLVCRLLVRMWTGRTCHAQDMLLVESGARDPARMCNSPFEQEFAETFHWRSTIRLPISVSPHSRSGTRSAASPIFWISSTCYCCTSQYLSGSPRQGMT